ncbi:hypothetical protein [Roseimicrobium sp. ORNL1]|uniref:hypothetical protein n=1 Tax=Roseimicrobium sp. ORNL1 TaxID=2711231 RepID=UPI0013E11FE8|nr:hypothetical protein [Roseimicrobium sp. ORNL1]QIF04634.1 hypothetical protein G5S37_24930 [Roseimicrobium sp. ORNL1]
MTLYLEPSTDERATEAELAEIRRQEAEERLSELLAMYDALLSRGAKKEFFASYGEEVATLSAQETHLGVKWIAKFLP